MGEPIVNIYWSTLQVENWHMFIAKTNQGLSYIGTPHAPFTEMEIWMNKKVPNSQLIKDDDALEEEKKEIEQYLRGERTTFSITLHPIGTDFQKQVWQALHTIDYGETKTYSEIAEQINRPTAIRAVGTAIGANPLLMLIPCHRVVAKDSGLAGFRAGLNMKKLLLELESHL